MTLGQLGCQPFLPGQRRVAPRLVVYEGGAAAAKEEAKRASAAAVAVAATVAAVAAAKRLFLKRSFLHESACSELEILIRSLQQ